LTTTGPAELFTVTQNGAVLSCRFDSASDTDLHEFCETMVPGPVTVTLAAGEAQTADGLPLGAGTWMVDTTKLPTVESGCVGYLIPL
jgi:hypothetical protein